MNPLSRSASLALLALFTLLPAAVRAGVPSPPNSTVPPCLVACPLGDIAYTAVVRDLANNPLVGSRVTIDFSSCPGVSVCGVVQDPGYTYDANTRYVQALTDQTGTVTFRLHAGGLCAAGVRVWADGLLIATPRMASPDQNGDQVVVESDFTIFEAKLGTNDLTADFDCNGVVDLEDQNIWGQHGSHSCYGIVNAVRPKSWGQVRMWYR